MIDDITMSKTKFAITGNCTFTSAKIHRHKGDISMAYLKDYMTGRSVLTIESGYVRDYMTGRTQYRIEGFLTGREKMALIAVLFG